MLRAPLLLALLLAPVASAAVSVERVDAPERTVAEHPFEAGVLLRNDGGAREVTLLAALYRWREGKAPCGPATGPDFVGFTHLVMQDVRLPADSLTAYPPQGERWLHRYSRQEAPPQPATMEWCVFVARSREAANVEYEDFASLRLLARATNAPPVAEFSWEPATPVAARDARFEAVAEDADGDPLEYRWDFGHHDARGRATATGPVAFEAFYPAGEYDVTLVVSDGFAETSVVRRVSVAAEGDGTPPAPTPQERDPTPLPPAWVPAAALLAAWALRRRR